MEKINFEKELNKEQLKAVYHGEGPAFVLSGAGTGKTRVLTYRIIYLLDKGIPPDRILALTFTNKAADEMKERIRYLIPEKIKGIWMGTFHSVGLRILREKREFLNLPENFVVYDREDSKRILKDILPEEESPRVWIEKISKIRQEIYYPDEYEMQIVKKYVDTLRKNRAVDFDDLLILLLQLFKNKKIREYYQNKFLHILVDEYQDTSFIQYRILKILSKKHKNLFIVGDEDQSIYAFRGARVENVFDILKDFPDIKIYRLEKNYRSNEVILKAANEVIKNNRERIGKTLYTEKRKGDRIRIIECENEREEAENVYEIIKNYEPKDTLILYRTNAQSRAIEEVFNIKGVPYQIVGALKFFERREIKDFISYLKFLINPYDYVSFERLIQAPRRGIGEVYLKKIREAGEKKEISILDSLNDENLLKEFPQKVRKEIKKLYELFIDLRGKLYSSTCLDISKEIYERVNFISHLKRISTDNFNFQVRFQNIEELFASMREFVLREENPDLMNYLQNIQVRVDEDNFNKDFILLMTVHNAKGLESKIVIITGMEEGLFPHYLSLKNEKEIEEERRLFYVGLTRAKEKIFLLYSKERWRRGIRESVPSRFLYELPEDCVIWEKKEREFKEDKIFRRGDRVYHPFWGEGIILEVADGKARINFFKRGYVTLVLRKVQGLKKIYYNE